MRDKQTDDKSSLQWPLLCGATGLMLLVFSLASKRYSNWICASIYADIIVYIYISNRLGPPAGGGEARADLGKKRVWYVPAVLALGVQLALAATVDSESCPIYSGSLMCVAWFGVMKWLER